VLRAEVEALLGAQSAPSGLDRLSIEALPQLSQGTAFGHYRVDELVGTGGMGQVYRATDTRLDRSVAIKILPAELAQNAQFKSRFEREAKTISQLNHPHICTLYDVGDSYLVISTFC